jgi:hypothetical protein
MILCSAHIIGHGNGVMITSVFPQVARALSGWRFTESGKECSIAARSTRATENTGALPRGSQYALEILIMRRTALPVGHLARFFRLSTISQRRFGIMYMLVSNSTTSSPNDP